MSFASTLNHSGPPSQVTQLFAHVTKLSQGGSRKMPITQEVVDLRTVVERAIDDSHRIIAKHGHELLVSLPHDPLPINADPTKLESVVMHLLDNAAKYTPEGGCIWVQLTRENDAAVLRVRDSGNGISAELLRCIFDFVPAAGVSKDGFGIGLAIAKGLVDCHDGSIAAHSDGVGRGSDFTVRLPVLPTGNESTLNSTAMSFA
jgi:signal transduction histidine kinase